MTKFMNAYKFQTKNDKLFTHRKPLAIYVSFNYGTIYVVYFVENRMVFVVTYTVVADTVDTCSNMIRKDTCQLS